MIDYWESSFIVNLNGSFTYIKTKNCFCYNTYFDGMQYYQNKSITIATVIIYPVSCILNHCSDAIIWKSSTAYHHNTTITIAKLTVVFCFNLNPALLQKKKKKSVKEILYIAYIYFTNPSTIVRRCFMQSINYFINF